MLNRRFEPPPASDDTEALIERARASVPALDPYDLARRLRHQESRPGAAAVPTTVVAQLGDQKSFWVLKLESAESVGISATLRYISPQPAAEPRGQVLMWVQNGLSIEQEPLQRSARTFEERIYPTVRQYFGQEWSPGIDGDARLTILNARIPGASGYFSSTDEFRQSVVEHSNELEMFYINPDQISPGTLGYDATLAHEFQHMVHWFADSNEDTWVNEGASELATRLCGYPDEAVVHAFARLPDTCLTTWDESGSSPHYGASSLFLTYFSERYGSELTRQLVANPANGIAGFNQVLSKKGTASRFEDLFADWILSNYLDGCDELGPENPYQYRSLDVQVATESSLSQFPAQGTGTVHPFAADYIALETAQDLWLEFEGSPTTRVIPNQPHTGRYQWWSNRGDNSDMTLTRSFDLSGLSGATLRAWLWHDIEAGWDYAYVEVSADGGRTWQILPGLHTSDSDRSGNGYGPGYTGRSAVLPGAVQGWIEESFDLSPFAGQKVQIRFEYLTDDSFHGEGLALDDISIPELGYLYDPDEGDGGWVAQGFVRHDNTLSQRYRVLLVPLCNPVRVQRLALDSSARGAATIRLHDAQCGRVLLVIAAVTPDTNEVAPYRYRISPLQSARNVSGDAAGPL